MVRNGVHYRSDFEEIAQGSSSSPCLLSLLSVGAAQSTDDKIDYSDLALPKPNSFIPKNLEIQNKVEVTEVHFALLSLVLSD